MTLMMKCKCGYKLSTRISAEGSRPDEYICWWCYNCGRLVYDFPKEPLTPIYFMTPYVSKGKDEDGGENEDCSL